MDAIFGKAGVDGGIGGNGSGDGMRGYVCVDKHDHSTNVAIGECDGGD